MPRWIPKLMMVLFGVTGTVSSWGIIIIFITHSSNGKNETPIWWIVAFAVSILGIIAAFLMQDITPRVCPSCGSTEYDCEEHDDRYGDVPYGCTKTVIICKNCGNTQD